jgi:hypothetical protein
MIYLLTAVGSTPGGSSTVHIYTQTVHRTTQLTRTTQHNEQHNITINNRTTQLTTRTTQHHNQQQNNTINNKNNTTSQLTTEQHN